MPKSTVRLQALKMLEQIQHDETYIIRKGKLMKITFDISPRYTVQGSAIQLLDVLYESIVPVRALRDLPIGNGKESFSGFGKPDSIRDSMAIATHVAKSHREKKEE